MNGAIDPERMAYLLPSIIAGDYEPTMAFRREHVIDRASNILFIWSIAGAAAVTMKNQPEGAHMAEVELPSTVQPRNVETALQLVRAAASEDFEMMDALTSALCDDAEVTGDGRGVAGVTVVLLRLLTAVLNG